MPEATETTVAITINGQAVDARPGELVIDAAERTGTYIPRFCYHHRMDPVGMCRMCLVDIDGGRGPALQPSCMVTVTPDMKVETESPRVKKAQDGILEFLLINHPLDCPVCDKGGECPLQDHTVAFGPGESRFVEEKRHFEKPIAISQNVYLDRERCILCDRCTRFAKDVAGDALIHFQDRGNGTQVNTFPDHPFASYFSGNTVQICPVGALTAKPYRFKARPWDLDVVESTCQGCAVGCRIVIDSSRNEVLRYVGVDSEPVNWSWLCDKGRFGFQAIGSEDRLAQPLVAGAEGLVETRWTDALNKAAAAIKAGLDRRGPSGVAIIGGSRLTNEAAYAWTKLAKGVIGTDSVDAQLGDGIDGADLGGLPRATIDEATAHGGVIVSLGSDLKDELPVLFLRIRDAVTRRGARIVELSPRSTSLTPLAAHSLRCAPGAVSTLTAEVLAGEGDLAAVRDLLGSGPLTVLVGRPSVGELPDSTLRAALDLVAAFPDAKVLSTLRRGNVHGAIDLGMTPGLLPGRVPLAADDGHWAGAWGKVPAEVGLETAEILDAAANGAIDTLILLGADPLGDFPEQDLARRGLRGARTVIAVETFANDSTATADIVLPAAGPAEVDGTTTNLEGRVTVVRRKVTAPGAARADWQIAAEIAALLGADLGFATVEDVWNEITTLSPMHHGIDAAALRATPDGIVTGRQDGFSALGITAKAETEAAAAAAREASANAVAEAEAALEAADAEIEAATAAQKDTKGPAADAKKAFTAAEKEAKAILAAGDADDADDAAKAAADEARAALEPLAAAHAAAGEADTAAKDRLKAAKEAKKAADAAVADAAEAAEAAGAPPEGPTFPAIVDPTEVSYTEPKVDAYSLRLVTARKLFDHGTIVSKAPALAGLGVEGTARANSADLIRLGVADGDTVTITSASGSVTTPILVDDTLPIGTLVVSWNQGGPVATELIDSSAPVTEVRLETRS
jgi:NADH-quinone oxidoreductase subunit G